MPAVTCVRGDMKQFNQTSKQMPFTSMIFVMRKAYSMSLRSMRWSLSETRTLRAGRRSSAVRVQCGPVISLRLGEKANGAMKAEMLGLQSATVHKLVDRPSGARCIGTRAISFYSSTRQYCRLRVGVQDKAR